MAKQGVRHILPTYRAYIIWKYHNKETPHRMLWEVKSGTHYVIY